MASSPTSFDPRQLAKLRGLRLRARHVVEGYIAGQHRSTLHGYSIEFAEHREYSPGDDLRHLDWKVFGRTDKFYLKQYEDETNLLCHLVVDTSESMTYQSAEAALSKAEFAQCLAASIAWLVLQQQDSVGLATFDSQIRALIRPSGAAPQLQQVLQVLENAKPGTKTSAGQILHELAERLNKRGVVVVISDLLDDPANVLAGLRHCRHRRHDVVVFHVLDPAELDFPFRGPTKFNGLEAMPEVFAEPEMLRQAYLREFNAYREKLEEGCQNQQIDYVLASTATPFDQLLARFLVARRTKVH
ncbi:DUF58 domain-containing protein [Anatilimnocola sp. NA78]|uniref:DUF58 domain-containing protein n=1 Tax=Anatilimnocola sp. NA78 TaxID=3415683 RepID=UPI003CE54C1D